MPLYGKIDQAVTANSTTTKVTTSGAPLGIAATVKNGAKVANVAAGITSKSPNTSVVGSRAAVEVGLFGNTTPGAFVSGKAVGIFGVTPAKMKANRAAGRSITSSGWVVRNAGTGPIVNIVVTGTATGYSNTDVVKVASPTNANASASITTNSTGGALKVTITAAGAGFTSVSTVATVANSTGGASAGSGATFTAIAGGRAGRVTSEVIVASKSITGNTSVWP